MDEDVIICRFLLSRLQNLEEGCHTLDMLLNFEC